MDAQADLGILSSHVDTYFRTMQLIQGNILITDTEIYGKPFYYLFYKSDIWFNISDIL